MITLEFRLLKSMSEKNNRYRILIVDDHPIFRQGISALISSDGAMEVCGQCDSAQSALEAMRRLNPDIALVDISLPGANGVELIKLMRAERPRLSILVLSMHDETLYALRALKAGANGYVMKSEDPAKVLEALHKVGEGDMYVSERFSQRLVYSVIHSTEAGLGSPVDALSDRELEVLRLLGMGSSTRDIAERLHLSIKTIETHRAHIKRKLNCKTSAEMVSFAVEWVSHEQDPMPAFTNGTPEMARNDGPEIAVL